MNPTFDGKAVKTEFSLNLPGKFMTRMQVANTQGDASFRGIDGTEMYLYSFITGTASDKNPVTEGLTAGAIDLKTTADVTGFDHSAAQDKWYTNVEVPVGTNAFLVYAQAKKANNATGFQNGVLNMVTPDAGVTKPEDISFDLEPINDDLKLGGTSGVGQFLLDALNELAGTTGLYNGTVTEQKAWSALNRTTDNTYYADLFTTFISLKAGSQASVLAFLNDLKAACTVPTGATGENALETKLAAAVQKAITAIEAGEDFTAENNIPDGAAVLKYDTTDGFQFVEDVFTTGAAWGANSYVYPAALWYRVNTGIRVDDELQSQNVGQQDWATFIGSAYQTANNAVQATSQSVALVNPLQYAVGNFETQIKFANENMIKTTTKKIYYVMTDKLDDEGNPVKDDDGNIIQVPKIDPETGEPIIDHVDESVEETVPVSALKLTGILIGDQKNVDWQALPVGEDADAKVIYDTDLIGTTFSATAWNTASQTLVLETAQDAVNVALEFQNNSTVDFTGVNNCIIPAGTKFYLIGQLKINEGANWIEETTGKKDVAIFEQDYKTIAKFLIHTLENTAYNVVPDLRTPKLEFGLSVDLEWEKGYTFNLGIGGDPETAVTSGD